MMGIDNTTYLMPRPFRMLIDTFGGIALSSLLICVISGVVLAVPYDVNDAYASISSFVLTNPGAVIARNMHYWSAQFFLVFSFLHVWDHLRIGTEKALNIGIWFRLLISIFVILYAMLSGFILKADADSLQALMIFRSLFDAIPIIGIYISRVLLGSGDGFVLLYVNHIALATIFIFLVLFEHSRMIWGKGITFVVTVLFLLVFSLLFQAPLHDMQSQVLKGPWYFLGLQEMLHWMGQPAWIWVIAALVMLPILLMPYMHKRTGRILKYFLVALVVFYAVLTIIGYFFRGEQWRWEWQPVKIHMPFKPSPLIPGSFNKYPVKAASWGRAESCLGCHDGMKGFSASHDPASLGCAICHFGNPFSPDKDQAHEGMLAVPGNLDNAARSCGTANCHPDITSRINTGLMATMSGIISVDRFVFNELPHPDGLYTVADIAHSPADMHLRNLCSRCHLGNPKDDPGPVSQESRGGGCNACHLNYSKPALEQLHSYFGKAQPDTSLWTMHPSLDLNIGNDHCFGCHSRSGRIATSYEGWHETLWKKDEVDTSLDTLRLLEDGRVFRYIAEDVHHTAGLQCVDCHDSYELMGDGNYYMHKEDQVMIGCEDCHFNNMPDLKYHDDLDAETLKILQLKGFGGPGPFLPLGNSGRLIWNSGVNPQGEPVMYAKTDGRQHPLSPPSAICSRGEAHSDLSCQSCHTAWVPQCIGCHNEYDPKVAGYDMVEQQERQGSWVEFVGLYLAGQPALGVKEDEDRRVHTFAPGMILSIDKASYDPDIDEGYLFHRLYAPMSAHTTSADGRKCRDCHNHPVALGYGHGKLEYLVENNIGKWIFNPRFAANKNDELPEDAWLPFLGEASFPHSTRSDTRPFTVEEQKRILLVGSCLECHDQDSALMLSTLDDFDSLIAQRSGSCILPEGWVK